MSPLTHGGKEVFNADNASILAVLAKDSGRVGADILYVGCRHAAGVVPNESLRQVTHHRFVFSLVSRNNCASDMTSTFCFAFDIAG